MKKRFLTVISTVLCAAMTFGSFPVSAQSETVSKAQGLVDGIIEFRLTQAECDTVQEWIDGELSENAGQSGEWFIFGLSRYGNYDFSVYKNALSSYLAEKEVRSASSRLKFALISACLEYNDSYIGAVLNNSIGEQGVMSYIYGLHILTNGYKSDIISADEAVEKLLSLRKNDGGWAVTGEKAETDATAMAVQALAPYYDINENVKTAVDNALYLLSEIQLESGDYSSYGVPNPESTGQVLAALTSLGIDPEKDERFIKNGNTLIDGINLYRNNDGSFRHEIQGEYNAAATAQVFYCLISYLRFSEHKTPLYILEENEYQVISENNIPEINENKNDTQKTDNLPPETEEAKEKTAGYKPVVCLIIAGIGAVSVLALILLKKHRKQNIIAVIILVAIGIVFVITTDFSSTDNYYGEITKKENPVGTVTLSIRCDTIAGKRNADYIPDNGMILTDTFLIEENESVFDILVEAAKKHSIQLDYSGGSDTVYVVGINYIYEFDFGDLSGWLYTVNGVQPSVGCDGYVLSDGDEISFIYSCEMGNDI